MRILFFGNEYSRLSIPCLQAAIDTGHSVTVGAHRPESVGLLKTARIALKTHGPAGVVRRGIALAQAYGGRLRSSSTPGSLTQVARHHGAPVIDVTHLDSPACMESLRAAAPDIILVAGFSRILKRPVIELPRLACINVHPSMLPKYRGPNPMYWVLANGESHTGVTVHFLEQKIDAGDIIAQQSVPIHEGDDERVLLDRCAAAAAELVPDVLAQFAAGDVSRTPQDPALATYFGHPPRGSAKS